MFFKWGWGAVQVSEHLFTQKHLLMSQTRVSVASGRFTLKMCWVEGQDQDSVLSEHNESSLHLRCLFLVTCASANTSLKFPVNLTDSNLILFLRRNSFPTLQMENVEQWLPLKTKPTPLTKPRCGFYLKTIISSAWLVEEGAVFSPPWQKVGLGVLPFKKLISRSSWIFNWYWRWC